MKLSVFFKTIPVMIFDNVSDFGIQGKSENILRIEIEDGRTHFINFSDVIACVECREEENRMISDYHKYGNIISNAAVYGLENAVMASKYPMAVDTEKCDATLTDTAKGLARAPHGSGHDNWLSGITVHFDLTCTVKMWTEFERYHFAQIVSSQSTMHRIERFDIAEQCIEYVDRRVIDAFNAIKAEYIKDSTQENRLKLLYSCPVGIKLTARINTNYLQLKTMFRQRQNHRLPEWRQFCHWVTMLPYSELITYNKEDENNG